MANSDLSPPMANIVLIPPLANSDLSPLSIKIPYPSAVFPTGLFPLPDPKHPNSIIYPENQPADDALNEPDPEEPDDEDEDEDAAADDEDEVNADILRKRMMTEEVELRVHDFMIVGNTKTKESVIEGQLDCIKKATTLQELLECSNKAIETFKELQIFDSVLITLDPGPIELPGTTNVTVEVVETESDMISGKFGCYNKPASLSCIAEGSLKFKNLFGYGDLWDGSLAYGLQTSEVGAAVLLPRIKGFVAPRKTRVFLLYQDWMKLSSYKERMAGLSLSLIETKHHEIVYNLGWRTLADPSEMASRSIRRQLGGGLHSSLKYTFTFNGRNSRPTQGYSCVSSIHIGGLAPDSHCVRFVRQELDVRYAVPFGFCGAALKFGVSGGVILTLGNGCLSKPSSLPDTFFLGGDFSPLCTSGGPSAVREFKTKGLGPIEPRRHVRDNSKDENSKSSGRDYFGDEIAVSAFADISFDLPLRWLRERGIRGHVFAGAENAAKLLDDKFQKFTSFQRFVDSLQTSVGAGIVIPIKKFLLECNYYYIPKKLDHNGGKAGFRFSISAPSI